MRAGELERLFHDLDALALQHIGKARVVLEMAMIEFRDAFSLAAVPIVEQRGNDPTRLDLPVEPDAIVELQGCGMIGPRAGYLLEEVVLAERLDHDDADILLRQREREAKPDWPGADDDHRLRCANFSPPRPLRRRPSRYG